MFPWEFGNRRGKITLPGVVLVPKVSVVTFIPWNRRLQLSLACEQSADGVVIKRHPELPPPLCSIFRESRFSWWNSGETKKENQMRDVPVNVNWLNTAVSRRPELFRSSRVGFLRDFFHLYVRWTSFTRTCSFHRREDKSRGKREEQGQVKPQRDAFVWPLKNCGRKTGEFLRVPGSNDARRCDEEAGKMVA